ncbi:hypothetical protein BBP40_003990 [Aspergillus hancockii]|nr:hypothetical protein BBP40_003990 [Aspergillus hancockii]
MAPIAKSLALAGALFAAIASSVPVQKRDELAASTHTTVVWTTVTVTQTLTQDQPTATAAQPTIPAIGTSVIPTIAAQPSKPTEIPEAPESEESWEPEESSSTEAPTWTPPATQSTPDTPTSQAPQPTPDSSTSQAPQPTLDTPTSSQAPQPTPPSGGSGSGGPCSEGSPCTGEATFYDTATSASNPSSCGWTNDGATENVLALSHTIMKDSDCGKTVTIKFGGKSVTGKVVDKCMGCVSTAIDLSRSLFGAIASESMGRLTDVEWFINA